ncbi:MAG: XRE family transcriptional regulator [bacterium]|nr:XRE family transcriptional regulator [bacterium]
MDLYDLERDNTYKTFLRTVAKLVRQKRICAGKTVEDIAYDALAHNSTSFYNSAENLTHDKHFNLKHLFYIAQYYECDIREFFPDGGSNDASVE